MYIFRLFHFVFVLFVGFMAKCIARICPLDVVDGWLGMLQESLLNPTVEHGILVGV